MKELGLEDEMGSTEFAPILKFIPVNKAPGPDMIDD
jgi:hypothetical protein